MSRVPLLVMALGTANKLIDRSTRRCDGTCRSAQYHVTEQLSGEFLPDQKDHHARRCSKSYTLVGPHIDEVVPKLPRRCRGCLRHTTHYRDWYRRPRVGFHYLTQAQH